MQQPQRINVTAIALAGIAGVGGALFLQEWRSGNGFATFSPPVSLPASLFVLAVILGVLARRLKNAVAENKSGKINPFHAVRLLAAARASQLTGALFGGVGAGLLLALIGRTVGVSVMVWLPMALTLIAGICLLLVGVYAEISCRVPPSSDEETGEAEAPETA